jgi:hypothetical protein
MGGKRSDGDILNGWNWILLLVVSIPSVLNVVFVSKPVLRASSGANDTQASIGRDPAFRMNCPTWSGEAELKITTQHEYMRNGLSTAWLGGYDGDNS